MGPEIRRAPLPPGCWWIVHVDHGRPVVILDEAVPADSCVERELAAAGVRMWREQNRRRGIGVFPASTVAAAVVAVAAVAASIVYVLTGNGTAPGGSDDWAEGGRSPVVAAPVERRTPPGPVAAGRGRPRPVHVPSGGSWSGRPAPAPTASPAPSVRESPLPAVRESPGPVRRPVRRLLRRTVQPRPSVPLPVKARPSLRPCELLRVPVGRCR